MRRARASGKEKKAAAHACITLCRDREGVVARARELRIVVMFKMKATQCFFDEIENERNAFSRLMGMELIAIDQLFQTVCPEPALAN